MSRESARPASVVVFGVLHLVFGAFGICGTAAAVVTFLVPISTPNPVLEIVARSAAFAAYYYTSLVLGLPVALLLIGAGILLLLGHRLGRTLSNVYAGLAVFLVVVGAVVNAIFLFGPLVQMLDSARTPEELGGAIGGLVGGTVGSVFGLVYPVVVLIFMNRKVLVDYFAVR